VFLVAPVVRLLPKPLDESEIGMVLLVLVEIDLAHECHECNIPVQGWEVDSLDEWEGTGQGIL
jgi:hypothetical protein